MERKHTLSSTLCVYLMSPAVSVCVFVSCWRAACGYLWCHRDCPYPSLPQYHPGLPVCSCKACSQLNLWGGGPVGETKATSSSFCLHCCLGHKTNTVTHTRTSTLTHARTHADDVESQLSLLRFVQDQVQGG